MKNKKDKKPRKIKNYLSSLSKWAKENKKKLICLFSLLALLLGVCYSSCRASKPIKANASNIQTNSQRAIFLNSMPNGFTQSGTVYYSYNYPLFLIPKTDKLEIYIPQGNSNLSKIDLTTVSTANIVEYTGTSYFLFSFYRTTAGFATRNLSSICNIKVTINYELLGLWEDHSPIEAFNILLFDITTYQAVTGTGYLEYYFYNEDDDAVMSVSFTNLNTTGVYHSYTFALNSFDFTYVDYEAFDYWYEFGKAEGYTAGLEEGFDTGFNEGKRVGLEEGSGLRTPLDVVSRSINDLFNIDLFGNVTLGTVISVAFGGLLLSIVLKVFLGG